MGCSSWLRKSCLKTAFPDWSILNIPLGRPSLISGHGSGRVIAGTCDVLDVAFLMDGLAIFVGTEIDR
jgi:hypothetical protein